LKLYTKTGDHGETSLFGGTRVGKDNLRIESYGAIDELNSIIGVCRSVNTARDVDDILSLIQNQLFTIGSDLATPFTVTSSAIQRLNADEAILLEKEIDRLTEHVQPLTSFILPGGNRAAAMIHYARTVCRRAERLVVALSRKEQINEAAIVYLNRLSDLLFILARYVNALSNTPEIHWNR